MAAPTRSALVLPLVLFLLPVFRRTFVVLAAPQTDEVSGPTEASLSNSSSAAGNAGREGHTLSGFNADSLMVQRALYVLVAITALGMLYFLVRAVRVKKAPSRKTYSLLAHSEDTLALTAASDDDDDNTLYDARILHRSEWVPRDATRGTHSDL
ncbi:protein FAM174C isoform X1 [Syngnathus typhle]|uniref:protein FAM174C isoform X1 n=1 Tax=Syngnathus typhle TaxID=161592 RepID=UPI002A6B83C0|nr:protein FAM174C isoform X1 [Syngnathus typhle]